MVGILDEQEDSLVYMIMSQAMTGCSNRQVTEDISQFAGSWQVGDRCNQTTPLSQNLKLGGTSRNALTYLSEEGIPTMLWCCGSQTLLVFAQRNGDARQFWCCFLRLCQASAGGMLRIANSTRFQ